jgi:hypothetical protein
MNFGQLLRNVIPVALEGKATGGSTTTLIDTYQIGRLDSDQFKDSIIFIASTTDGLAPADQFSLITGYNDDGAAPTFTFSPAMTVKPETGDYYQIGAGQYNLYMALRVCNRAVRNMGMIPLNDTSLTASTGTFEYTLPLALKNFYIEKVEIGNATDGWTECNDYYVTNTSPGTQNKLIFKTQPPSDTIKLWYRDYHPTLDTYDDIIAESLPEARVIAACKLAFEQEFAAKDSDLSDETLKKLQLSRADYAAIKAEHGIYNPSRRISKFLNLRDIGTNY